jgi:hypothetical protein
MNQLQTVLDALENSVDLVEGEHNEAVEQYGHRSHRKPKIDGLAALVASHKEAISIVKQMMLAQPVAWFEFNESLEAWFLAYGHNPKAKTRQLYEHPAPQAVPAGWLPIESAPIGLEMFIIRGFDVRVSDHITKYTTDAYAIWQPFRGKFERWPHRFEPTHWMPLPPSPKGAA